MISDKIYSKTIIKVAFIGFCLIPHLANCTELAIISGHPDFSLEFVQRLVSKTILIPGSSNSYETDMSTEIVSLLDREEVANVASIETIPDNGSINLDQTLRAIEAASQIASVVLIPIRGEVGSNELECQVMARFENIAFVIPAGTDGTGNAIDIEKEPHCLAKNILTVASMNQKFGTLAYFSNFGKGVRLAAPGINIPVVLSHNRREKRSGMIPPATFAAAQLSIFSNEVPKLTGAALIELFLVTRTITLPTLNGRVEENRAIYAKNLWTQK